MEKYGWRIAQNYWKPRWTFYPEGVALIGADGQVVFWNRAAEAITGYAGMDLLSRQVPEPLEPLLLAGAEAG